MKNLSAYIGIAGALGMAVSDVILLGRPVSGWQYDMSSFGAIVHIAPDRAAVGAILGLICSFFICFGFWHMRCLFLETNQRYAMYLFISFCSMMFFGGAFHAAYYFVAQGNLPISEHRSYLEVLSWIGVPGFVTGAFLFFWMAMDHRFPKWFRFCNPFVLSALFLVVFTVIPAPLGGYLKPTFVNLATASFFALSLRVNNLPK